MKIESPEEYALAVTELLRIENDFMKPFVPSELVPPHVTEWHRRLHLAVNAYLELTTDEMEQLINPLGNPAMDARFKRFIRNAQTAQAAVDALINAVTNPAGANAVVHHLHWGFSACPLTSLKGTPANWPDGHRWSEEWKDVTCPACLEQKP